MNIWECQGCNRIYTTQDKCNYCNSGIQSKQKPPKKRKITEESPLEAKFIIAWRALASDYPEPIREYEFHPDRDWRFDFAFPDKLIAIELEGGVHSGGRHVRGTGYVNDLEKYNEAVMLGWRLLRYESVKPAYIEQIKKALDQPLQNSKVDYNDSND